jgi:dolichyl-diphosphooligosaccharide--protein glycosyltransferase
MSLRTGSDGDGAPSVLDRLEEWYTVPALLVVMVVMLRIRLLSYDAFVRGEDVLFSGNDAWYHLREVNYTVRNWPATMPFDPWTYFPFGTSTGQFGTLYDQLVATAALAVGLGSPSSDLVAKTLLVAPAVFGALTAVPTYLIGKRLGGRVAGLFGAVLLALLPGLFLSRTLVGVSDHNGVEPFFQAFAILGMIVAVEVAERELPIWELVADRDVDALRTPTLWAALGGFAVAMYMWVWPPGVLVVGIIGVFTVVKMASDVRNGDSPEPVAYAVAVSMLVTAVLMLVPLSATSFSPTQFSLIQPGLAVAVAAGAVFLAWLARQWDARDVDADLYPVAVLGLVFASIGALAVAAPGVWSLVENNLLRIVGFAANAETRTIGEAQPYLGPSNLRQQGFVTASGQPDRIGRILNDYGFTLFTAIAATVWLVAKPLLDEGETRHYAYVAGSLGLVVVLFLFPGVPAGLADLLGSDPQIVGLGLVSLVVVGAAMLADYDGQHLLVVVWAAFVASAAFTQLRFHYYLAVVVAVLNAFLVGELLRTIDLTSLQDVVEDVETYQVLTLVVVVLVVLAPVLVVPLNVRNTGSPSADQSATAWVAAENHGPQGVTNWDASLQWMSEQTPAEGELGGANSDLPYYGTYSRGDGDFAYPEGSYGVQSWWDYGHWITVRGERIPNANPFQQGATSAANFLLAPNETAAEDVLAAQSTEGENTRFVMVDWQMATPGSKFDAPVVFYDRSNVSSSDFYEYVYQQSQQGGFRQQVQLRHQRYYESLMVRLYEYHGSAMEPERANGQVIVVDYEDRSVQNPQTGERFTIKTAPANGSSIRQFPNVSAARSFVQRDGSAQIGGVGPFPSERVPALEHYRLVRDSAESAGGSYPSLTRRSYVKTFERVPGATVRGSNGPPNATVTATVRMRSPTSNSSFTYTQRARTNDAGEFTMTLPYSTTGYADYGPENGYTNVSVRSTTGHYVLRTPSRLNSSGYIVQYGGNLTVPEGEVNGAEDGEIEVALERRTQQLNLSAAGDVDATVPEPAAASTPATASAPPADADGDAGTAGADGTAHDPDPARVAARPRLAAPTAG